MQFAKLTYPQAPVVLSEPLLGGKILVNGSLRIYSLERPVDQSPIFILKIDGYGQYAISIESMLKDVINKIEDKDPK